MAPAWTFGLWLSTSFTTDYDETTVNTFLDGMADRDIATSVFHFDCFWMKGFEWCDFKFDKDMFPDAKGQIKRMKERGLRVSLRFIVICQEAELMNVLESRFAVGLIPILRKKARFLTKVSKEGISSSVAMEVPGSMISGLVTPV